MNSQAPDTKTATSDGARIFGSAPLSPVARSILFLVIAYTILFVIFSFEAPNFLSQRNLFNILRQLSLIGIIGVGMTMIICSAEIDLSVGSVVAFTGVMVALFSVEWGIPLPLAAVLTLAIGAFFGSIVGALRVYFGIPSFITSLALLTALRSGSYLISGGFPISPMPDGFEFLGNGWVGPVPVPVIIMFVIFVVGFVVMRYTSWGRAIYAVGGNEEAARLSGISVARVKIGVFAATGTLSALAGMMLASRLDSGTPTVAQGLELDVIAAVIIGGTSLFGGAGSVIGTLLGALFMATLKNGMVLIGVSPFSQGVVSGVVILLAVLLGSIRNRRR